MHYSLLLLLVATISAERYVWNPDSNWGNTKNWNGSRLPCAPEIVQFQLPVERKGSKFAVKIDLSTSLKKLKLPSGASLRLGSGIRLKFSSKNLCQDQGLEVQPDAMRPFIGLKPHPWECANNWLKTSDGTAPSRPPCEADTVAFAPGNTYSWIAINSKITVGEIDWMGTTVQHVLDIPEYDRYFVNTGESSELLVDIQCTFGERSNCPCISSDCSFYPENPSTAPCDPEVSVCPTCAEGDPNCEGNTGKSTGGGFTYWPIIVGVLGGLLLITVIIIVVIYFKRRNKAGHLYGDTSPHYRFDPDTESLSSLPNPTYMAKDGGFENPVYDNPKGDFDKFDEDGLPIS